MYATPELSLIGRTSGVVLGSKELSPFTDAANKTSDPALTSDTEW